MIDSHQHFWDPSRGDYHWLSPASELHRVFLPHDLKPLLLQSGVVGTVAVQAAATSAESDFLLQLTQANPWILGVIGWIDLTSDDACAQVRTRARNARFVGVRPMLQELADPSWILRDGPQAALETLTTEKLVFDALVRYRQLPVIASLAERHSGLSIVLDHAGKPPFGDPAAWSTWEADLRSLAGHHNVSCKLSGLLTECPTAVERSLVDQCFGLLMELFGPERLIWGSDWPVATMATSYADWLTYCRSRVGNLAPRYASAIFGDNARRIYRLARS